MFQSIRNFFRDAFFGKDELPTYVWHNGQSFTITLPYSDDRLTQAELQMLQRIMSQHIRITDSIRVECKEIALNHPVGHPLRNDYFREHRAIKAHLKKLSALQYRLKHKIAARG